MSHMYHQPQPSYDGASYQQVNQGYGSSTTNLHGPGDKEAYPPTGYTAKLAGAGAVKPWYKKPAVLWGIAILIAAAIAGAVVGGILGSRHNSSSSSGLGNSAAGIGTVSGIADNAVYPSLAAYSTDTNSNPLYATSTTVAPAQPTVSSTKVSGLCSPDTPTWNNQSTDSVHVRTDHPKLFTSASKWNCLPAQIAQDAYLASWNATIFGNATRYAGMAPTNYSIDGGYSGSGVLDVAREVQLRIKHWAYAWRLTNDSSWADRTWEELVVASGNSSQFFGRPGNEWNTDHFLDVGEFTLAFAYAYDWMYDAWNATQRDAIMWSIIELGLKYGLNSYTDQASGYSWWQATNGNWNCVCNGGLTLGALAIASEDPTGIAQQVLANTIANSRLNCMQAIQTDGTWSETSDYWYFGTSGQVQMVFGLITATGSDQGLLAANSNLEKTGLFHMYGMGFVQKFNYGDCGPNKYTATANGLMFYGEQFNIPAYTLFQRDRIDAPEPLSMFYYNPDTTGDFWYNMPLDHYFPNTNDAWSAMRSSWTDDTGLYAAIKSANLTGHQTHGDIDIGDFVFEALGQRWAGELCQNNYLDTGYFSSEAQDSQRWLYYRTRTEGQNTILYNASNQLVSALPSTNFDTTNDIQTSLTFAANSSSASYFTSDLSSAYSANIKRGMRLLNARRQMLLQDEFTSTTETSQWRMHTNATITYSNGNRTANLALGGENLVVEIQDSAPNLTFETLQPLRLASDPPLPTDQTDLPNPGVSVLAINVPAGTTTLEVLFNPQWPGMSSSSFITPSSVPLSSWSLISHSG